MDLSPNHSGILMGLSNGSTSIFSIISPLIVQYIVTDQVITLEIYRAFALTVTNSDYWTWILFNFLLVLVMIFFFFRRINRCGEPYSSQRPASMRQQTYFTSISVPERYSLGTRWKKRKKKTARMYRRQDLAWVLRLVNIMYIVNSIAYKCCLYIVPLSIIIINIFILLYQSFINYFVDNKIFRNNCKNLQDVRENVYNTCKDLSYNFKWIHRVLVIK